MHQPRDHYDPRCHAKLRRLETQAGYREAVDIVIRLHGHQHHTETDRIERDTQPSDPAVIDQRRTEIGHATNHDPVFLHPCEIPSCGTELRQLLRRHRKMPGCAFNHEHTEDEKRVHH